MFTTLDLENFLKEHEVEWWSPSEIRIELGVDLRTVKNVIRKLDSMNHKGWRLDIAERSRLYAVRMVRDIEGSENLIKAEISEVESKRIRVPLSSEKKITLDNFVCVPPPG